MLFLSVRGFLDYAGPNNPLAITWLSCCLPPLGMESASCSIGFSKLNSPAHRYLCLRFKRPRLSSSAPVRSAAGQRCNCCERGLRSYCLTLGAPLFPCRSSFALRVPELG